MTVYVGTLQAVQAGSKGSWVVGDIASGETQLFIADMSDFHEDGGVALVDDVEYLYTEAVDDEDGDYLTLADPLADDVADRAPVTASPAVPFKTAMVDIGEAEVYLCDIPMTSAISGDSRLDETMTSSDQQVLVEQAMVDGRPSPTGKWTVIGFPPVGTTPQIDGANITPATALSEVVNLTDDGWSPLVSGLVTGSNSVVIDGGSAATRHQLIMLRSDSDTNATSANPLLTARELFLTDDGAGNIRAFYGDGATHFNSFTDPRGMWVTYNDFDAGGGGGGGTGGVDIDCGDAGAVGVEIDCGGA